MLCSCDATISRVKERAYEVKKGIEDEKILKRMRMGESSGNFFLNSIDNTTNAKLKIEDQDL